MIRMIEWPGLSTQGHFIMSRHGVCVYELLSLFKSSHTSLIFIATSYGLLNSFSNNICFGWLLLVLWFGCSHIDIPYLLVYEEALNYLNQLRVKSNNIRSSVDSLFNTVTN